MAKGKKKRHLGGIIALAVLIVVAAGLFFGRNAIIGGVKAKAAKVVAQKLLEEQMAGSGLGDNVDVSEFINNLDEQDIEAVTEIAEKYVNADNIGQYIDMAKNGNISEIKEQVKEQLTDSDKQQLENLYDKYKDQIDDMNLQNINPEDLNLEDINLENLNLDDTQE